MVDASDRIRKRQAQVYAGLVQNELSYVKTFTDPVNPLIPGEISLVKGSDYRCNNPCYMDTVYGSLYFTDTTPSILLVTNTSAFTIGTGSFTIEWFQYLQPGALSVRPFCLGTTAQGGSRIGVVLSTTASYTSYTVSIILNGTTTTVSTSSALLGRWVHFAIVGNGTNIQIYLNGVAFGSTIVQPNITNSTTTYPYLVIGGEYPQVASSSFKGYITGFRWANIAVYTTAFTPPKSPPQPVNSSTVLLLNAPSNNYIGDSSGTAKITGTDDSIVVWALQSPY